MNEPNKIIGYRTLIDEEIELVNSIKAEGAVLKAMVEHVEERQAQITKQFGTGDSDAFRWCANARPCALPTCPWN